DGMTGAVVAAALDGGPYVSPIRVGVILLVFLAWAACAQWVDRDTDVVKTRREQWNLIILSGALVAAFGLFVIPVWSGNMFPAGVAFWVVVTGAPILGYIMHRNGRVRPDHRVLTLGHAKRLLGLDRGKTRAIRAKAHRVQIGDHEGKFVDVPDDYEDALAYSAVQDFLYELLWRRASQAELTAGKERYRLVYKVDGVLAEHDEGVPTENGERIIRFIKKIAGLNVEEVRRPQVGRIEAALLSQDGPPGKMEVRTSGTTAGERLSLRMESETRVLRLPELGLAPQRLEALKKIIAKKSGLFLLSSPREHGLTTTQYAILRSHDAYMNHIHTLERRPLTEVDNVTQQPFDGANTDVHYARALQTVLRREPDIVLVGECEDHETARLATRAAAEGRKIYMGIEAADSFEALERYLKLLRDPQLAAKTFLGAMGQRLVRVLCTECREAFEPDPALLKKLNLPADKIERFFRPPTYEEGKKKKVCQKCQGSGYYGRTGIFELLVADDTVRQLIASGAPIKQIKAHCRKNRMYYLQEEGILKVIDGTTSMNEVLRCLKTNARK
ncbi:MAG: hypothetical protein D6788_02420, partial [Planctomycetota bacterium]